MKRNEERKREKERDCAIHSSLIEIVRDALFLFIPNVEDSISDRTQRDIRLRSIISGFSIRGVKYITDTEGDKLYDILQRI